MKLYTSAETAAPNPRRVGIFLKEKGLTLPTETMSLFKGEHRTPEHKARYSRGQVPVLELDDGSILTESIAICRYLDALHPEPPLFGRTPLETARVDMWTRRVELILMSPLAQVWVNDHPLTAPLGHQYKDFGAANRPRAEAAMRWLDSEMGDAWLAGDAVSIADIVLLTTLDFGAFIGCAVPDDCAKLSAWAARMRARPSVAL